MQHNTTVTKLSQGKRTFRLRNDSAVRSDRVAQNKEPGRHGSDSLGRWVLTAKVQADVAEAQPA